MLSFIQMSIWWDGESVNTFRKRFKSCVSNNSISTAVFSQVLHISHAELEEEAEGQSFITWMRKQYKNEAFMLLEQKKSF